MAEATGGQVRPYGVAISDALADPNSTLEQLSALRDQGRRELAEIGDLSGALEKLEAEIKARGSGPQGAGGWQPLYGVAIHDAISDPSTTLDQLQQLRDAGRRQLEETGDLPGALEKLEAELSRRQ